ncbi:MAG: hypothetical protein HOO06_09475 [Bdellovibrionaceae bacterium]|jgi:hypothetical protein|nr:hypothetical protein [Pseudobdellovibrionaceae bacterium]
MEFADNINNAIKSATKTLELSQGQYREILEACNIPYDFDIYRTPMCNLAKLWKKLGVPEICYYEGYNKEKHLEALSALTQKGQD